MEARGITLLELIVAVAIVSAASATALWGAHAWLPDFRLGGAVRQVVIDLRRTRARAVAAHASRRLVFNPGRDSYQAQQRADGTYADDGPAVELPPTIDLTGCSAIGGAIAFSPRGTASTFGTVTLRAPTGRELRVIVDIAGRIRVQ